MMTDDDLDLLASSYLDGEATADEVAQVENDSELLARVEQLRAVRLTLPAPPPGLARAQLARAMADYRPGGTGTDGASAPGDVQERRLDAAPATGSEPAGPDAVLPDTVLPDAVLPDPVVDLAARRSRREGRLRWLTSAAALLVVGVGSVAVFSRLDGGDDEMATADVATEATEAATAAELDAADGAEADLAQTEMAPNRSAGDTAGSAAAGEVEEEEATAGDEQSDGDEAADSIQATGDDQASDAEESLAVGESETGTEPSPNERFLRDLPEAGFFPDEPVAEYGRLPTTDEMVGDLDLPWRDETGSRCLDSFPAPGSSLADAETEVIAHLPFEVTGGDDIGGYEALYVIVDGAREAVVILEAEGCTTVSN